MLRLVEYKLAQERLQELIALSQGNAEEKQQRRLELEEQQKRLMGYWLGWIMVKWRSASSRNCRS